MIRFERKKSRIIFSIIVAVLFSCLSLWLILEPEKFLRNYFSRVWMIQLLGGLVLYCGVIWFFSGFTFLFRKGYALEIGKDYLIENARFESVGEIKYDDIKRVSEFKKYSVEIVFKDGNFLSSRLSIVKKIVHLVNDWGIKNRVVFSCQSIDGDRKEIVSVIQKAIKEYRTN